MKFYLIQRGSIKPVPFDDIAGIDQLVQFDYMGSAEFEFGALSKALKSICKKLPLLEIKVTEIEHDGKILHVISVPTDFEDIVSFLEDQCLGTFPFKTRTKEYTRLNTLFEYPTTHNTPNFWWDIENDWIVTINKSYVQKVLRALKKVKEKKGW